MSGAEQELFTKTAEELRVEKIISGIRTWSEDEQTKYCDELGDHPLFSRMGESELKNNKIVQAVHSAEYDEFDTPESLARESKEKGNAAFGRGVEFYGMAIKHYTDALTHAAAALKGAAAADPALRTEMRRLESTCHSNLAAIYLARGKHITVIDCCTLALRAWPDNVKAAFRAAKSCLVMGRAASALEFCELGRTADATTKAFDDLVKEATAVVARQTRMAAAAAAEAAAKAEGRARVRAACTARGIQVGPPLYNGLKRTLQEPYVDASDCVHWPVAVLYPATGQSDYVEDFPEVASLSELLEMLLPDGGPTPAWDERREYVASNVDVFYKSHPCKPLASIEQAWTQAAVESPPEDSWQTTRWVRVPPAAPLLLPLVSEGYVVADLPVLYVVARSSSFYADMKRLAGGAFVELRVPELPPRPDDDE